MSSVTYQQIRDATRGEPYTMSLVGQDIDLVVAAVNTHPIDAHLEACNCPGRGDRYERKGRRLECEVSVESFPTLVRRLAESEDEEANSLAVAMLAVLDLTVELPLEVVSDLDVAAETEEGEPDAAEYR